MVRTDRFWGFLTRSVAGGTLLISYIRFVPQRFADLFDAPLYVGYQLAFQLALLLTFVLSVVYLVIHMQEQIDQVSKDFNQSLVAWEEIQEEFPIQHSEEDEEQIATDGGARANRDEELENKQREINNETDTQENAIPEEDENWREHVIDHIPTKPTGRGALAGLVTGGVAGLLFGQNGLVVGALIGGFIGNEIEYQAIQKRRKSILEVKDIGAINEELSESVIHELLKNHRRRAVIEILLQEGGPVSLGEMAERIAAKENEENIESITRGQRKRVYVGLYQVHLPKLHEAGIIEFDRNRGQIRLPEGYDPNRSRFSIPINSMNWNYYYISISVTIVVLFFIYVRTPEFQSISPITLLIIYATLVVAPSIYQIYS